MPDNETAAVGSYRISKADDAISIAGPQKVTVQVQISSGGRVWVQVSDSGGTPIGCNL